MSKPMPTETVAATIELFGCVFTVNQVTGNDGGTYFEVVDSATGFDLDEQWPTAQPDAAEIEGLIQRLAAAYNQTRRTQHPGDDLPAFFDRDATGDFLGNLTGWVRLDLRIENTYELHEDVTEEALGIFVPAPPAQDDEDESETWAEWLYVLTGVGHEDGDSWYDVTITASSDPALVDRTFAWGY